MSKITREAVTYLVQYSCDECEKIPNPGCFLIRNKILIFCDPPKYNYHCPNCKKEFTLAEDYPFIFYG